MMKKRKAPAMTREGGTVKKRMSMYERDVGEMKEDMNGMKDDMQVMKSNIQSLVVRMDTTEGWMAHTHQWMADTNRWMAETDQWKKDVVLELKGHFDFVAEQIKHEFRAANREDAATTTESASAEWSGRWGWRRD